MESLLTADERLLLQDLALGDIPVPLRRRALLLLLCDEDRGTSDVANSVGLSPRVVRHWRRMFGQKGMSIFPDRVFPNKPADILPQVIAPESVPETVEPEATDQPSIKMSFPVEQFEPAENIIADILAGSVKLEKFIASAGDLRAPGLLADDSLADAGRKIWLYNLAQMLINQEGTRLGEDIEALHDMRVATRRMRAAFEIFGDAFDQKALRLHLKRLRLAGRTLGQVRDLDVFIEKAHLYGLELSASDQEGVQPLLEAWKAQRQASRMTLVAYLDGQKYHTFVEKFYRFLTSPEDAPLRWQQGLPVAWQVRDIAPRLIYTRLAAVRAFDAILEFASIEQFHALRIEFKKLRYTLEFFREVLGDDTKLVIGEIKILQDHLGNLNDAQVATGILRDFLQTWDANQSVLPVAERMSPEPVIAYLQYQYRHRQELLLTFKQTWERFNQVEFRQKLAAAVAVL